MKLKKIKVTVPATSANLGAGFDVLGLALQLYTEVEIGIVQSPRSGVSRPTAGSRSISGQGPKIEIDGEGASEVQPGKKNIVWLAARKVFDRVGFRPQNLYLKVFNRIPLARGLGSSAAVRLGGLVCANEISGRKLTEAEILKIATQLEGHPDNVVPAFWGGLCVCLGDKKEVKYLKPDFPPDLQAVVCIPEFRMPTAQARKILPEKVTLKQAVFNISRVALFLSALRKQQYQFLSTAMEDCLHQPYRQKILPGMKEVLSSAKKNGALGAALSGSGSTIIALVKKDKIQDARYRIHKIGEAMVEAFARHKIKSQYLILDIDNQGIRVERG